MKPTHADLAFWNIKKAPRFARALTNTRVRPWSWSRPDAAIHAAINSHAPHRRSDAELAAGNLLAIVQSMKRRMTNEELRTELVRLAANPGTVINPGRRAGYALKWAAKMGYFKQRALISDADVSDLPD